MNHHADQTCLKSRIWRLLRWISPGLIVFAALAAPLSGKEPPQKGLIATLEGPAGEAIEFSHDGSLLLTVGENRITVWNLKTLKPVGAPFKFPTGVLDEARFLRNALSFREHHKRVGSPQ